MTEKGKAMEQLAFELIPPGMGEELKKCPMSIEDYGTLASQLDIIIESLKK